MNAQPSGAEAPLTLGMIEAAARRIAGSARRTALLSSSSLDAASGAAVVLKPEIFQRSGSFKFRGALNRLLQLTPSERAAGVVAYSSGNHGAAVALAASLLGLSACVVVPTDAPELKVRAIAAFGAELRRYDPGLERREEIAEGIAAERGGVIVRPFDDYQVMAGQGTVGLELAADVPELELAVVPVGGGGLIAGTATALRALAPRCRVLGVEPAGADDTRRSLQAGRRIRNDDVATIADGLRAPAPGELTFPINRMLLEGVVAVEEAAIVEAMRFLFERLKIVVEPSGAVGVAALLAGAIEPAGARTAVVLSGGNVDAGRFAELVGRRSGS